MSEVILRRDPTRPAFWYLSFVAPHPPLVPPTDYLALYNDVPDVSPVIGDWCAHDAVPQLVRRHRNTPIGFHDHDEALARRGFLAQCTYVDHQLRTVIGTLREAGILDDTIIVFTSDHGDMLGDHGLWAKRVFFERSANVPLIVSPAVGDERIARGVVSDRLTGLADVMPTLLELAGSPVPETVEGVSVLDSAQRYLVGEFGEGSEATRMVHDGRWKLIYYPAGNVVQLFDTATDRRDERELSDLPEHSATRERLLGELRRQAYGDDLGWYGEDGPIGFPADPVRPWPDRGLLKQRGLHL